MLFKVFKFAKRTAKFLKCIGNTETKEYWEFRFKPKAEDPDNFLPLTIEKTTNGTKIHCTCKQCSIFPDSLCTYKAALIWRKVLKS